MRVKKRTLKANDALREYIAQSPTHQKETALEQRFRWPTLFLMAALVVMYCIGIPMVGLHLLRQW
jgi:hypothetical protein